MRKSLAVLCAALFLAAAALADGPTEPGVTDPNQTATCSECAVGPDPVGHCDSVDLEYSRGRWADCQGGQICYWSGYAWYCEPYCGRQRCYFV